MPSIEGSEDGELLNGWEVHVEFGTKADAPEPLEISVSPSWENPGHSEVRIIYGRPGNRSSLHRLVEGFWRGGKLLSGSTLELFD
ncbi:MAG: hypothetical protein AAGB22_10795 [Bacteroidota bacterium]